MVTHHRLADDQTSFDLRSKRASPSTSQHQHQQHPQQSSRERDDDGVHVNNDDADDDADAIVVSDKVQDPPHFDFSANLSESELLALAIKFSCAPGGRMCAALTHGHSFESSIFRLPAKCAGCHELVWGPFTRGCTCLTCKLTAHRSCTGMAAMPDCPTKKLFADFCRSELGLQTGSHNAPGVRVAARGAAGEGSVGFTKRSEGMVPDIALLRKTEKSGATHIAGANGDLHEWSTVDGTAADDMPSERREPPSSNGSEQRHDEDERPPASTAQGVRDLGSSFSWSPFGSAGKKRVILNVADGRGQQQQQEERQGGGREPSAPVNLKASSSIEQYRRRKGESGGLESAASSPPPGTPSERPGSQGEDVGKSDSHLTLTTGGHPDAKAVVAADAAPAGTTSSLGRDVGRMSVAGGVVGAVLGGPVGAFVGLKVGAFIGAGRWSVQELWQRIEKDREAAGAGKGLAGVVITAAGVNDDEEEKIGSKPQDIWAQIAEQIETVEKQPLKWELDLEQKTLLEQGECDAGEVAMFVVGKVLADETGIPCRLYDALLAEFRARHRLCECRRLPIRRRRRSRDTDMVELFPRAGGSRRASADDKRTPAESTATVAGVAVNPDSFFASTPGLEKTFSFVEEAEIVEGEGSETLFGDDGDGYSSSIDGRDRRDGAAASTPISRAVSASNGNRAGGRSPGMQLAPALAPSSSTPSSPGVIASTPGARRSAVVAASKELWRQNSGRLDSWVELEGTGCSTCGGRVVNRSSSRGSGRYSGSLRRDVEDDEGGLGERWAAADVPPCWCRDEGGLSTSPDMVSSMPKCDDTAEGKGASASKKPAGEEGRLDDAGRTGREVANDGGARTVHSEGDANGQARPTESGDNGESGKTEGQINEECDALRDVHGVLRELTRVVLAWCPLLTASDEGAIQAVNCIDQRVFSETYGPVYGRIASGKARESDATLAQRVRAEEKLRKASALPSVTAVCWPQVTSALRAVGAARTGRDKLGFFVQAVERISEALPPRSSTDTLLWSLCRHLAAAALTVDRVTGNSQDCGGVAPLARPHAEVAFVEQFVRDESWLMGKAGYVLTTVDAALHVLLDPAMSHEIFSDPPELIHGDGDVTAVADPSARLTT